MRYLLHIAFLFLFPFLAFAQSLDPKFEHITTRLGLSQNHVTSIFQDKTGFLWIGTFNGLNRYDGYSFKIFSSNSNDTTTISQNSANVVYQDREGAIWVGTEFGLNKYNAKDETFTRYYRRDVNSKISTDNNIRTIYEDGDGVFWVGFYGGGIMKFYPDEGRFEYVLELQSYFDEHKISKVNAFYADKKGYFWLGTEPGGLIQYQPLTHQIVAYTTTSPLPQRISDNIVSAIVEDANNCLWIGTWAGGINKLNLANGEISTYKSSGIKGSLPSNIITSLVFDKRGDLWVSTFGNGIAKLDLKSQLFESFRNDVNNVYSLNHDVAWRILQDREGVIWVGTFGGGLNKLNPSNTKVQTFKKEDGRANWLNENNVSAFCETKKGKYLVGTIGGGVNVIESDRHTFSYLLKDSLSGAKIIRVIYEDADENIWVSTDKGLCLYNQDLKCVRYFRYQLSLDGVGENSIYSIVDDKNGSIWFSSWMGGIRKLSKKELTKPIGQNLVFEKIERKLFENRTIWSLFLDKKGDMWFGSNNTVYRYNVQERKLFDFSKEIENSNLSKNFTISSFSEDVIGKKLWFGTTGIGLGYYDYQLNTFSQLNVGPGHHAYAEIFSVLCDSKSSIWFTTSNGLSQYNQVAKSFRNFEISAANSPNELFGKSWLLRSEEIFVASNSGFYIFNPIHAFEEIFVSPIVITDFRIFHKSIYHLPQINKTLDGDINNFQSISIGQENNVFSFQFSVLDYRNPKQNEYRYMLEGFDKDWVTTTGENRVANYTNIDAGTYTFKVNGANSDGIWNNKVKEVVITIVPPFYNRWYFRLLIAIIILSFFGYLFLLKYKSLAARVKARIVDSNYKKIIEENTLFSELTNELEVELDEKSKEVATLRLFIQNREDNLNTVKLMITESLAENGLVPKVKGKEIVALLSQEMKEKNSWDAFKENIDVLQHDFITKLANDYPRLTQKDLIVCAYIKMAKSNKDIASHLNISAQSVEMTRYRIRKKMELNSRISLNDFLARL